MSDDRTPPTFSLPVWGCRECGHKQFGDPSHPEQPPDEDDHTCPHAADCPCPYEDRAARAPSHASLLNPMILDTTYVDLAGWMPVGNARMLRKLIQKYDVKTVLEVGPFCGLSTLLLALNTEHVTTIDTFAGDPSDAVFSIPSVLARVGSQRDIFDGNMEAFGVAEKVEVLTGRSHDVLDAMKGRTFDLVYIDGAHDFETAYGDILRALPMATKVLCGDDYSATWPGVRKAVDQLVPKANTDQWLWYQTMQP
jgi:predicted O-methyltransferase YrrM